MEASEQDDEHEGSEMLLCGGDPVENPVFPQLACKCGGLFATGKALQNTVIYKPYIAGVGKCWAPLERGCVGRMLEVSELRAQCVSLTPVRSGTSQIHMTLSICGLAR